MLPSAVTFNNYRSFAGRHEFEVRPLTLIYGANNVGKSALVRLFPLLADSVAYDATGALALESQAVFQGGYNDLWWKGREGADDVGLGLCWSEGPLSSVDYVFDWREHKGVLVRLLELIHKGGSTLALQRTPQPAKGGPLAHVFERLPHTQTPKHYEFELHGMVPLPSTVSDDLGLVNELASQLQELRGRIQWLRAQRGIPGRRFPKPSGVRSRIAPDGSDTPQLLWSDRELQPKVSEWFEQTLGRSIELVEIPPDEFRCTLRNTRSTQNFEIDLVDSGSGPVQALPIITAATLAMSSSGPRILALEEPDANLDPRSQHELAKLLCTVAASPARPRVIVETHSQALLLGLQLAIANHQFGIGPDDVLIYWVRQDEQGRSSFEKVELDADGRLQGLWPDPFAHLRDLARELVVSRQRRLPG